MSRLATRLFSFLAHLERREVRWAVLILSVLLCTPAVLGGLALDDYVILDHLHHGEGGVRRALMDLFVFVDGAPARSAQVMDTSSGLAWWTYEGAKGAFFRPLASFTHWIDATLWPHVPELMYVHSLLWLGLLLAVAGMAYRRLVDEPWVAGLAFGLFALDEAHAQTAGWISNRSALLATVFAVGALVAHHRARIASRSASGTAIAVGLLAIGLLSSEFAVGILGYLFAYACFRERGPFWKRLLSLWPYGVLVVVWRLGYVALGYGTRGLETYLDPLRTPAPFLEAFPERWTLLVASQLGGPPSDLATLVHESVRGWFIGFAVIAVLGAAWLAWPTLARRRESRFWALGAGLSAIPTTGTWPSDRLLLLVGLGVMPLLAYVGCDVLQRLRVSAEGLRTRGSVVLGVLALNLVIGPAQIPLRALSMAGVGQVTKKANRSLPSGIEGRTVVIVTVPTSLYAGYIPVMRDVHDQPRPEHLYWLAEAPAPVTVRRVAPRTLRVTPEEGFLKTAWARNFRSTRHPLARGRRVRLDAMTVEVVEVTGDGRPSVCDFHFDRPLDSPHYVWQRWKEDGFVRFEPPALGHEVTLPAHPVALFGPRHGE